MDFLMLFSGAGLTVRLDLVTYENGSNYDFKDFQTLDSLVTTEGTGNITYSDTLLDVEILEGESLCLAIHITANEFVDVTYNNISLLIEEDSFDDEYV